MSVSRAVSEIVSIK